MLSIKILLICYLLAIFEPYQNLLDNINNKVMDKIFNKKYIKIIYEYIFKLFKCYFCNTFWLTLLLTSNIYLAIINVIAIKLLMKMEKNN